MVNFLRYLHYRLYKWNLKTWGEIDGPAWNALLGLSFLMLLNLIIPLVIIQSIFGVKIFISDAPKLPIIIVASVVLVGCYFLFNHRKRYLAVSRKFEGESRERRRIKLLYIWIYVVLSFTVPFVLLLLLR